MDEFFREGGPIDIRQVRKMAESVGLSEKRLRIYFTMNILNNVE